MKQSEYMLTRVVLFGVAVAAVLLSTTGCEWTSSGEEGSWSDSMSWVNFSGLYRAPAGRTFVGDFASSGGIPDGGNDIGDVGTTDSDREFAVTDHEGPIQPGLFTVFSGTIDYANRGTPGWRLKPGSVNVTIVGTITGPVGAFSDDGSGALSGTFSQAPGGQSYAGSGTINYDTGAWNLTLEEPFPEPAQISYSYVIVQSAESSGGTLPTPDGGGGDGDTGSSLSIAGGVIASIQVEQLGNRLTFRTSRGHTLTGRLGTVTLPGGDRSGRSAGDVTATYEVQGDIDGQRVRITGSFSGVYVPPGDIQFANPAAPIIYGILSNRILQGIWLQPSGSADVYGAAPQQSVPVNVGDFQAPVAEAEEQ